MKIKRLTDCFLLLLAAGMLAACSSNDDNKENNGTNDGKKVDARKALTFKVNIADYNEDQEVGVTRADNEEVNVGRQVLDLGNGILAQCTLQRDTTKQMKTFATRALPDDTYTMLAYDHTTHAFCGAMSGKVTGGAFVYTGNESMELPVGTYDFVLFNSKVQRNGNLLTVTRANAGDALIGRTTGTPIFATPYHGQQVSFTLKHVAAKVKVKLTGYTPFSGITATLSSINATDVPSSSIYDASTGTWSLGTGAATSNNLTYGASQQGAAIPGGYGTFYVGTSNEDAFYMPSTDVSKLKLSFTGGSIYNLNMVGTSFTLAPKTPLQLAANGSYVLNVKLAYNFLYLMSNGDVKPFSETTFGGGSLTPIAVVISRSKHMAVALRDASNNTLVNVVPNPYVTTIPYNTYTTDNLIPALKNSPSGLDETWKASSTPDGTIKANDPTNFPAYYYAAHYNPGVTYTGTPPLQWYLPSMSDFNVMISVLLFQNIIIDTQNAELWNRPSNPDLSNLAFSQVGGTPMYVPQDENKFGYNTLKYYWSSTSIYYVSHGVTYYGYYGRFAHNRNMVRVTIIYGNRNMRFYVRAFVKY